MACRGTCHPEKPLASLLCPDPVHVRAALEGLSRSVQENRQTVVEEVLQDPGRESYIRALGLLLRSTDSW